MSVNLTLTRVRIAFCDSLFTPEQYKGTGRPRYGCALLVAKDDEQAKTCKDAIMQAGIEKWGTKFKDPKFRKSVKLHAFRDGDEQGYDGFEGCWSISANRAEKKGRPTVVDRDKSPLSEADGRPYGGCYVDAQVDFYADDRHDRAINCGLVAVRFREHGPSFAGGSAYRADAFEDLEGEAPGGEWEPDAPRGDEPEGSGAAPGAMSWEDEEDLLG